MLVCLQAEYRAWQKQEEERQRLQQQIVEKLKQERVDQLADKNKRRQRVSDRGGVDRRMWMRRLSDIHALTSCNDKSDPCSSSN